jgi:hypothetical protein
MADRTVYEELNETRKLLAAAEARAKAAEQLLYDRYMVAILGGLTVRYEFATGPATLLEHAERLTLTALKVRRRWLSGESPNVAPVALLPAKKEGEKK